MPERAAELPPVTPPPVGPPPVVAPPVPLDPPKRTVGHDVDLVDELFGTWLEYVYGRREDAEAWARIYALPSARYKVFCLFNQRVQGSYGREYAVASAAYLTLPGCADPAYPGSAVAWYYSGHIDGTARALARLNELDYMDTPHVPFPTSLHLPRKRPTFIKPGKL